MKTRYIHYFLWIIPCFLAFQVSGKILTDSIKPIPFMENWDSASFTTNHWTFPWMQGNWTILTNQGYPQPCAAFTGSPSQSNYTYSLRSPWFDATDLTCDNIYLGFDLRLDDITYTGTEKLRVEIEHDSVIKTVAVFYNNSSLDWQNQLLNIIGVEGKLFRVRFIAYGQSSNNIIQWMIDNITITRKCKTPENYYGWSNYNCSACIVNLVWTRPSCTTTGILMNFIFDDGTPETGWRINPGVTGWLGNEFLIASFYSGLLKSFQVYFINDPSGSNQMLSIDVFDGSQTIIGSSTPFQAIANIWITVNVNDIPFVGPFYGMVKWNNLSGNSNLLGYDTDGAFSSQDLEWYYDGTSFKKISDPTVWNAPPGIFLMRANALVEEKKKIIFPSNSIPMDSSLIFGYNVYRKAYFDTLFQKLNNIPVPDTIYMDTTLGIQQWCAADYYITTVYSNNCESQPTDPWLIGCYYGINGLTDAPTIFIFPNPADGFTEITSKSEIIELKLMDFKGKVLLKNKFIHCNKYRIELSDLFDGIYLLSVATKNGSATKKISILHQ